MLTNEGLNQKGQTNWTLRVPDEHCRPGLEVNLFTNVKGLVVGGFLVTWDELAKAKEIADNPFSSYRKGNEQGNRLP